MCVPGVQIIKECTKQIRFFPESYRVYTSTSGSDAKLSTYHREVQKIVLTVGQKEKWNKLGHPFLKLCQFLFSYVICKCSLYILILLLHIKIEVIAKEALKSYLLLELDMSQSACASSLHVIILLMIKS